jgi:putative two-component system protein, hydrogenase maturation factor HypX/HoxX
MRILFLTRSFNSLTQRLYLELTARGHEVSVEFDISEAVSVEAVTGFKPALVIAPFLKRAIPESIWRTHLCLVVHPGIVGDRGPSALDRAISEGEAEWGVTVLQAVAELDAGPVWATETFAMRDASKSSLYRNEVTEAASRAVLSAVQRFETIGTPPPIWAGRNVGGRWRPLMRQDERRIDWQRDDTQTVLRKIRAADGTPGVLDEMFGIPCHLFDAHAEPGPAADLPGQVFARRADAVLRATVDAAVWIGHVRRADTADPFKLPVALAFPAQFAALPDSPLPIDGPAAGSGWREIRYQQDQGVGTLHFPFYNGAMSTVQCQRLDAALQRVLAQAPRILVLAGGPDFWSNGIHLNVIEAADSPADESWRNIQAIDDLTRTLIEATDCFVIAAMQGNAGAGGVFVALAADAVWARSGVLLNPHYKNMGNLYGSEYWTYLLPRRLKGTTAQQLMNHRLPVTTQRALQLGLVDRVLDGHARSFVGAVQADARALAFGAELKALLRSKQIRRAADEAHKPLAAYRRDELERMHRNFYGFDPSYHVARSNFVHRVLPSWTPRHLSIHRRGRTAPASTGASTTDAGQAPLRPDAERSPGRASPANSAD